VVAASFIGPSQPAVAAVDAPIGMGTVSPVNGGLQTDLELNASRGCPANATGFDVRFSGGAVDGAVVVQDYTSLTDIMAAPGQPDAMTVALPVNLDTIRAFAGVDTLKPGVYDFIMRCRTQSSDVSLGAFIGAINVESSIADVSGWSRVAWPTKPTVTSITAPDTVEYGAPVTVHIDVKTYRDIPVGTVQLFVDGRPASSGRPLSSGAADISIDSMAVGSHSVTARYVPSRSDLLASSSDSVGCSVVRSPTQLQISASTSGPTVIMRALVEPAVDGIVVFTYPGGTHQVRASGGAASYSIRASGSMTFGARFVPTDKGYDSATADGAAVGSPPVVSVSSPPSVPADSPRDSGGSGAGSQAPWVTPRQQSSGTDSQSPTSGAGGATPGVATTTVPTRSSPTIAKHGSAAPIVDALTTAGTSNPSADGALSISVEGVVVSTSSGTSSTSYAVDAPIGAAASNDNVVTLEGALDASAAYITMTGSIVPVVVRDTRPDYPGYEVTGTVSDLSDGSGHVVPSRYIGWSPQFVSSTAFPSAQSAEDAGLRSGGVVLPADSSTAPDDSSVGLGLDRPLFVSPPGVWAGTVTFGAILEMHAPTATPPGDYQAVLTLTVTGAVL
jgi:predicted secreted protein